MNTNGIGLGLVIIDNIINQFGGKIGFNSKPSEGSEFYFTFKLENELTAPSISSQVKKSTELEFRWKPPPTPKQPERSLRYVKTLQSENKI
jgi:hypothetical protein